MDYKIICNEESFIAERENWNDVCKVMKDASPFQTWEWNYIWWKYNEPKESLFVIKAFEAKKVYGYAPLVIKNNMAEFIGGRDIDFGKFVVAHKEVQAIEGFINILKEKKCEFSLQEMPSRDSQLHIVQKILGQQKRILVHKTTRAAYVDVSLYDSFEDYFKLLSASMRNKTIKAGLKKGLILSKEPVTDKILREINDIYSDRQDVRGGTADITWAFPVIQQMYQENLLNVYIARDQEEAVGFLVSMLYDNAQYIWLVAFKAKSRNSFPGQLLFYQAIKDGFEDGNKKVDFMRGDYDFKMRWECELDTNYTVFKFNSQMKYLKHKIYFYMRPRIKHIVYSNPALERIYKKHAR